MDTRIGGISRAHRCSRFRDGAPRDAIMHTMESARSQVDPVPRAGRERANRKPQRRPVTLLPQARCVLRSDGLTALTRASHPPFTEYGAGVPA
jgi:hypothetical protein